MGTLLSILETICFLSGVGKTTLCKNDTVNIKQDLTVNLVENDNLEKQQLKDKEIELYNNYIINKYFINIIIFASGLSLYLVFDNQIIIDNVHNVRFLY